MSLVLTCKGSSVVAAGLCEAHTASYCADVVSFNVDIYRVDACAVVSAGGAHDDHEVVLLAGAYAEERVSREDERTDIQGSAVDMRNPVLVDLNELVKCLEGVLLVDLGDNQTLSGNVHSLEVLFGTEELNISGGSPVGFHALKDLLTIVEDHSRRHKFDRTVGHDSCVMPALTNVIVHDEHVVGEDMTEAQLGFVSRLLLGICRFFDSDIHDSVSFPAWSVSGTCDLYTYILYHYSRRL